MCVHECQCVCMSVCVCVRERERVCACVCELPFVLKGFCMCMVTQGFRKACEKGLLSGHKVAGVRFVLQDGKSQYRHSLPLSVRDPSFLLILCT